MPRPLWFGMAFLLLAAAFLQPLGASGSPTPTVSSVDLGTVPRGVAVDPTTGVVYAVLFLNGTTVAIDGQTLRTIARVGTPSPYAIAVDSVTDRVYVSQGQGASISVVDGSSDEVVATVQGAGVPYSLAVDAQRDLVFGADTGGASLWIVNGSTDSVAARIPMGDTSALAVDPATGQAFIGNATSGLSGTIEVVDTNDMTVVHTVPIPFAPSHFLVDPASHMLFVSSGGGGASPTNFLAIDDASLRTVYAERLGGAPNEMAFGPSGTLFVSDVGDNRLYEVDESTGAVVSNSTGDQTDGVSFTGITAMAFNPETGDLYITENEVTDLIILSTGAPASSPTPDYPYIAALVVAVSSASAALLVHGRRRVAA